MSTVYKLWCQNWKSNKCQVVHGPNPNHSTPGRHIQACKQESAFQWTVVLMTSVCFVMACLEKIPSHWISPLGPKLTLNTQMPCTSWHKLKHDILRQYVPKWLCLYKFTPAAQETWGCTQLFLSIIFLHLCFNIKHKMLTYLCSYTTFTHICYFRKK